MWDSDPRKVLVGVDGPSCEAALRYAVDEAVRRGCGLHVVHVNRPALWSSCAPDDVAVVEGELRRTGELALGEATARAQRLFDEAAPGDERFAVSSELSHGSVVAMLQSLSAHACLVVLEHHRTGRWESATLSVAAGAAAVSSCPVAAVPVTWRPSGVESDPVAVGVGGPEDVAVLAAAVEEARRRGAGLRVVHVVPDRGTGPWRPDELDVDTGGVSLDLVEEHGRADQVLHDRTAGCAVVVVGRHHRKHVVGATLGRTARSQLAHSEVPVLVVPATAPVPRSTQSTSRARQSAS